MTMFQLHTLHTSPAVSPAAPTLAQPTPGRPRTLAELFAAYLADSVSSHEPSDSSTFD